MMGSVSRPKRARATCPSMVTRPTHVVDWRLAGIAQGWAFASSEQATAFRLRVYMHERATARRSCPSRLPGRCAQPRAELRDACPSSIGPIQGKTVLHKPFTEIPASDRAGRNRAAIRVEADWNTIDGTAVNEGVKFVRCLRAAMIL